MSKATEDAMNALHGQVAQVLSKQLGDEYTIIDDDGQEQVMSGATPQTINAAITFLKNNNITSTIEDDTNLAELEEQLKAKRNARGRKSAATADGNVVRLAGPLEEE